MLAAVRSCVAATILVAAAAALLPATAQSGPADQLPVVVVRGLGLDELARLEERAAVGLLVPDAGPRTSEARALASLERGEVVNSLRGELPSGSPLVEVRHADTLPAGPAIVLALPKGGMQPNDRRYPIALLGAEPGLLSSSTTRIPGLVSVVDVAPTALGREGALRTERDSDAATTIEELDRRIADNGDARLPASLVAAAALMVLALVRPGAAALGFATVLATNLALGIAGVSDPRLTVPAIGLGALAALPLAAAVRSPVVLGFVFAGVLAAYVAVLGLDGPAVALSPLGPTQNARFHGISNLLETMLLVPALAGAALLARRYGPAAFAAVAGLALAGVAASRLGADGGGAVVLAAGYAVLALGLVGVTRRSVALVAAAAGAAVALVALDAAVGSTHVGETVRGGPDEIARALADRVELSWQRATDTWAAGLTVVAAVALLVWRVTLARRLEPRLVRALCLAFAAAIAVSLVVNDSPVDVAIGGLVGYLALERFDAQTADAAVTRRADARAPLPRRS
jgi:hypothetical protein